VVYTKPAFNGERLRLYRERAEVSAREVAAELGVTVGQVYNWERGDSTPRGERLAVLADLLHVNPKDLFDPASGQPYSTNRRLQGAEAEAALTSGQQWYEED
jgi:transcriptional regulator with XRE-family HTH domain